MRDVVCGLRQLGLARHEFRGDAYSVSSGFLAFIESQIGAPHRYPVLAATVRGGTVRSFSLKILAAGD